MQGKHLVLNQFKCYLSECRNHEIEQSSSPWSSSTGYFCLGMLVSVALTLQNDTQAWSGVQNSQSSIVNPSSRISYSKSRGKLPMDKNTCQWVFLQGHMTVFELPCRSLSQRWTRALMAYLQAMKMQNLTTKNPMPMLLSMLIEPIFKTMLGWLIILQLIRNYSYLSSRPSLRTLAANLPLCYCQILWQIVCSVFREVPWILIEKQQKIRQLQFVIRRLQNSIDQKYVMRAGKDIGNISIRIIITIENPNRHAEYRPLKVDKICENVIKTNPKVPKADQLAQKLRIFLIIVQINCIQYQNINKSSVLFSIRPKPATQGYQTRFFALLVPDELKIQTRLEFNRIENSIGRFSQQKTLTLLNLIDSFYLLLTLHLKLQQTSKEMFGNGVDPIFLFVQIALFVPR